MESFHRHLRATLQLVKESYDLSYSQELFLSSIQVIQSNFPSTQALWDMFQQYGPTVNIDVPA
jgi:hypothetical protein